jgi:branched-subunit amino acid ABC-type transport system permease component
VNYWFALVLAPLVVGILGVAIERLFLKHLYKLDPLYGLLLTFGLALIFEGIFRDQYGVSAKTTRARAAVRVPPTWASCSCPTTAPGSCWPRWWSAWAPGT